MVSSVILSSQMMSIKYLYLKALYLKLIISFIWFVQMYNFCLVLLVKLGMDFTRRPLQFELNSNPELHNTPNDPLKYLTLWNLISAPTAKDADSTWCGNREISDVLLQIIFEMCTKASQIVLDISASTRVSHRACTAFGWHFIGFEANKDIFDALLKPLCESGDSIDDNDDDYSDEDPRRGLRNYLVLCILSLDFNVSFHLGHGRTGSSKVKSIHVVRDCTLGI